ncbi:Y-family DNA polymerase [Chitinophaga vietnamensis]|uniref:Y-family DNA polymerase n=1 Tax=Chitinophaga vietnamensis TaxID=2593957 RepID=UPI001177C207|nr:DNA polymerase Y family protein [Chitinophaga vietnamensis]
MPRRYVSIWFCHLLTDWQTRRQPALKQLPFVFAAPDHGRMKVTAANKAAQQQGIDTGATIADAKALVPALQVLDDIPGQEEKLLTALGHWCIRYTPVVAIDPPAGLLLDASGCAHLWGGELPYLKDIVTRLRNFGYDVRIGMADSIGAAWAIARYRPQLPVVPSGEQTAALLPLPPTALRLEPSIVERLQKLGLHQVNDFIHLPRSALRRRFGAALLQRLHQAMGTAAEAIIPLEPPLPYQERLPSLEPIKTATGITIALQQLLDTLCQRLERESNGLRSATFKCYRVDDKTTTISIGTNRASHNAAHLFKLFELKIAQVAPGPGIELFVLEAPKVEAVTPAQEALWAKNGGLENKAVAELLDRITNKTGKGTVHRYLPDQHHWPERSIKSAVTFSEQPEIEWRTDKPRPLWLLPEPAPIQVAAPIPDYPPMLFIYRGQLHRLKKADGPERIEREWWLETGEHRDYYNVEDEEGRRYWIFRLGHYDMEQQQWFIHGFFS